MKKSVSTKKKIKSKKSKPTKITPVSPQLPSPPQFSLPKLNIQKVVSGLMTFQTAVKNLSTSLQKMESILNSTFKLFTIASQVLPLLKQNRFSLPNLPFPSQTQQPTQLPRLPSHSQNQQPPQLPKPPVFWDEEVPVIHLPNDPPMSQASNPLNQIDLRRVMELLQSPMMQNFLRSLFESQSKPTSSKKVYSNKKKG